MQHFFKKTYNISLELQILQINYKKQKGVDNDTKVCYYLCVDNETKGGIKMNHPIYVNLYDICLKNNIALEGIAFMLKTSSEDILKKIKGYEDFTLKEAEKISSFLNESLDFIFFTQ